MTLKPKRRLAAIFVADVFEFSRMMAEDEAGTLERILDQQKTVIAPEIERHDGRVIKLMGDGVLAVFPSVISAVEAAAVIQRRVNNVAASKRLKLRIGLNLGEVMIAERDIYGDGVNVASRIEALAPPGGVALSASAHEQVRNKIPYAFEDFGTHTVKNIPDPVQVYLLGQELTSIPKTLSPKVAKSAQATLVQRPLIWASSAVLVLAAVLGAWLLPSLAQWGAPTAESAATQVELGPSRIVVRAFTDSQDTGLAVGLAEGVIAELAQRPDLVVIAPHSSFARPEISDQNIAAQLDADFVISGRVEGRSGLGVALDILDLSGSQQDYLRLPAQPQQDMLSLQAAVVRDLLKNLPSPNNDASSGVPIPTTQNANAYKHLIQARSYLWADNQIEAKQALQNALVLDPAMGEARGLLAMAHMDLFSGALSGQQQRITEAQLMLSSPPFSRQEQQVAIVAALNDDEGETALAQAQDMVATYPNYADGYATLAWVLTFLGEQEQATEALKTANQLNPLAPAFYHAIEAELLFLVGKDEAALTAADQAIAMDPSTQRARLFRVAALANDGAFDAAAAELRILTERDRNLGLSEVTDLVPYSDPAAAQRILTGLRLAGLNGNP
ncbi:adenylate/guanylate cyclase domain-containing protein [Parasedimentitalea maritima]|uniref:Adenylate/guanylate cyclase domain-containing protein n=1 Tax=Parasedimentitalea maritima TaxID=2578117 RepID=A0A6A4RPN6_9RHOB|nr:adenylate/guanylate cyclase domain-containing protein [Zongyanglinia marina]KAE9632492.1 adenylate/guanylate cyclase domain-containing protein [Zongyanglinia marina]